MLATTEAIVLRTVRTSDSGVIVDMLTEAFGRLSFAFHTGKGKRGTSLSLLQALSIVEIDFDMRDAHAIQHLRSIRMAVPYSRLTADARRLSVALFLNEFLTYASRGCRGDDRLYPFVRESLLWYDHNANVEPNFHIIFIVGTLHYLGFVPNIKSLPQGDYFDLQSGEYTSTPPSHPHYVPSSDIALLPMILTCGYEGIHHLPLNRQQRNRTTDILLEFCRLHLPQFPELRSLEVVRSLF